MKVASIAATTVSCLILSACGTSDSAPQSAATGVAGVTDCSARKPFFVLGAAGNLNNYQEFCRAHTACSGTFAEPQIIKVADTSPSNNLWSGQNFISVSEQDDIFAEVDTLAQQQQPVGKVVRRIRFTETSGSGGGAPWTRIGAQVTYATCVKPLPG